MAHRPRGTTGARPGDSLRLCSDGLTRHVSDERVAELLGRLGRARR